MKVIHMISGGDVGGAKTHVHTLLHGLCKTENVLLVCFMEGPFVREARELGIPTRVMAGSLRKAVAALEKLIPAEGFEIIHCHGSKANLVGSLLRAKLKLPTVTTVHSDYKLDYLGRPFAALTYGLINRRALRKMDYWIGVSSITVDMLNERGFDPNRTFVIFNGVPFDLKPPKLDREAYLRSVGIEPEAGLTVFGIAARINPVKDMGTLIRAFAATLKRCPKARLIIAGDGEQRQQMEALAAELCPKGTYTFAGWVEDTDSFYSALDVNMLTSLSEGFPYALPEGASRHCATIATRVGGVPALVEHEVTGLLFEPKDVETLTEHMVRLANDPELIRVFADRIFEKTKAQFSVDATVARQQEIYQTILRRYARAKSRERDGILICGAYGKGNSGDDAILNAMVVNLRRIDPDMPICVISHAPKRTAREVKARCIYTFSVRKISKLMKKTVLYLSGGGSLIQDSTSSRSLWYYLNSMRSAKRRGNKVMMFSCGIGPVRWNFNRKRACKVINRYVDSISLRDRDSFEELQRLGVTGVPARVTADMAFLVEPAVQAELERYRGEIGLAPEEEYLIIAPRPWSGTRQHLADFAAAAVRASRQYGLTPVLLAMEPSKDRQICAELAGLVRREVPCLTADAPDDVRTVVALIRGARGVLGMRLHSLVFAAAQGTPFAGIAYDPKVTGFMDYMGQGKCCKLDEVNKDILISMVDALAEAGCGFADTARRLQGLAEENCRLAFSLIETETDRRCAE